MRFSLKTKITTSFVIVILVLGAIITFAGVHFIGKGIINQAQGKVRLDMNTAREVYKNRQESIGTILEFTAIRPSVKKALLEKDRPLLEERLNEVRREGGLDMLSMTDSSGRVVLRSTNPSVYGDDVSEDPIIGRVIADKTPLSATEIIPEKELTKEGGELAMQAQIKILPTPRAESGPKTEERDGMILKAAAPVLGEDDKLIGVIYGGELLNRDYKLVDKIKDIVFRDEKYEGKDIGTATIFQGGLRISTNVMMKGGRRATGTRISKEVSDQVLKEGKPWVDEAFVVNDWYITSYEPIRNLEGKIIGMLYVGMLKKPFVTARFRILSVFLGIVFLGVVAVIIVANYLAGRITKPLKEIQEAARLMATGRYSVDIKVDSMDEVGDLAESLNEMTRKLFNVQNELKEWGDRLEDKVDERTARIREIQRQLIHAEKMASVGRLAAGVAHEINNPLTGILTNSSLLLEDMKDADPAYESVKTIVDETLRCREIVKGLLDFSRQTEPQKERVDVNELIRSVIALVKHQVSFRNIIIREELTPSVPIVMIDKGQVRQVFMNIILNAADAMPHAGEILIKSGFDDEKKQVVAAFTDTGRGINKEHLGKIFDPFFSTKQQGTGLGLSISYGIIERHGGTIEVDSDPGKGSTFVVRLPSALPPDDHGEV